MVDAEELSRLLAPTVLGGRPVETLDRERLLIRIAADEVWPAWQAARSILAASGRWPVAVMGWGEYGDVGTDLTDPEEAAATVTRARDLDPWASYGPGWRDIPFDEEWVEALVRGRGLTEAEARGFVDRGATLDDVDRYRLERALAETDGSVDRLEVSPYLVERDKLWFTPSAEPAGIAFLTTASPTAAIAHVYFYGGGGPEVVAVVRDWHERFGAELVAAWTTMLQFVTGRRPATVDEAWELAGQHLRVGGSLQFDRDQLALALLQTDFWFLHDRP